MAKKIKQASAKRQIVGANPTGPSINLIKSIDGRDMPVCSCKALARASCTVCFKWLCRWHTAYHEHNVDNNIPELLPPRIPTDIVRQAWKPVVFIEGKAP